MARDDSKQFIGNGLGFQVDYGDLAFGANLTEIELETNQAYVNAAVLSGAELAATPGLVPIYTTDRVLTNGSITIQRHLPRQRLTANADDATHITTYNWVDVPIGVLPVASTIRSVTVYNQVKAGGTPVILLGTITTAGVKDEDALIAAAKAKALPANARHSTLNAAADFTSQVVPAGALVIFGTSGATTTDPSGLMVEIELEPVCSDATTCHYTLFGTV